MLPRAFLAILAIGLALAAATPAELAYGQPAPPTQAEMPGMERSQGAMPGMAGDAGRTMMCQCPKALSGLPGAIAGAVIGLGVLLLISAIAALASLSVFLFRRSKLGVPLPAR